MNWFNEWMTYCHLLVLNIKFPFSTSIMVYRFHQVPRLNISDPFKVYSHSHICLCIQNTYFHKLKQCRLGLSKQESYSHHKHTHTCIRTVIPAWPKRIKNFRLHFVCLLEFQNKLVPRTNFAFCLFFTKKEKNIRLHQLAKFHNISM